MHSVSPPVVESSTAIPAHEHPSLQVDISNTLSTVGGASAEATIPTISPDLGSSLSEPVMRVLHLHNFTKALKEITPSSSEALGSLTELRKWNDEFGEGRRDRKRRQVWGKGRFGFTDKSNQKEEEGRVLHSLSDDGSSPKAEK
jgi:hypothetical protein